MEDAKAAAELVPNQKQESLFINKSDGLTIDAAKSEAEAQRRVSYAKSPASRQDSGSSTRTAGRPVANTLSPTSPGPMTPPPGSRTVSPAHQQLQGTPSTGGGDHDNVAQRSSLEPKTSVGSTLGIPQQPGEPGPEDQNGEFGGQRPPMRRFNALSSYSSQSGDDDQGQDWTPEIPFENVVSDP